MAKWRQDSSGKLIPIDEAAIRISGVTVRSDIDSFVSPIDGTVVSGARQYREHCKKHDVVNAAEYSPEYYERKAKERSRLYTGEHTTAETLERKQEIYETMMRYERNGR